jgi:hypothetical protein
MLWLDKRDTNSSTLRERKNGLLGSIIMGQKSHISWIRNLRMSIEQ